MDLIYQELHTGTWHNLELPYALNQLEFLQNLPPALGVGSDWCEQWSP